MNNSVIFTWVHKDNVTVALDGKMYVSKVTEMLQDTETWNHWDPTKEVVTVSLRGILVKWRDADYIPNSKQSLLCSGDIPRTYILLKIHKQNCPFHLIVSSWKSPLSISFPSIIIKNIPKVNSHIEKIPFWF